MCGRYNDDLNKKFSGDVEWINLAQDRITGTQLGKFGFVKYG
jgi:hypothetical protein